MDHLHAYWRMEYIETPRLPDDATALIIHRGKLSYLILNRYPYNAGHLLAVPFRAATDLVELTAAERADLMDEIILGKQILTAAIKPDAFNVGFNLGSAAGGSIPHLHVHIVPRWGGDTNFMPVLADAKVIVEHLEEAWGRIRKGFEA
jgi:ATP adenylyltransferase